MAACTHASRADLEHPPSPPSDTASSPAGPNPTGAGASPTESRQGEPQPVEGCLWHGPLAGAVRPALGQAPYVWGGGAPTRVTLVEDDTGTLSYRVELTDAGWHLHGVADPANDAGVRFRNRTPVGDAVVAEAGSFARIVRVSPDAVVVSPLYLDSAASDEHVELLVPAELTIDCRRLTLVAMATSDSSQQWPRRHLPPGSTLHSSPNGREVARISADAYPVEVSVIAEQGKHRQVSISTMVDLEFVGWVSENEFVTPHEDSGGFEGGILMGSAPSPIDECVAVEKLELSTEHDGEPTQVVGWLEPGTKFTVFERRSEAVLRIEPAKGRRFHPTPKSRWLIEAAPGSVRCTEQPAPSE